jgi:plastocyanin
MRQLVLAGCALATLAATVGCGGDAGGGPSAPGPPPSPSGGATTITIVGVRGSQSFAPNPSSLGQGERVAWRNTDDVVHRIRFNDDSLDTGNIAPGATSAAMVMPTNGANYHCSIHPTMIGSIRSASGEPPPCQGPYCDD